MQIVRVSKAVTGLAIALVCLGAVAALATFGLNEISTAARLAFGFVAILVLATSAAVARTRRRLETPYW